jgi:hypothetical protein
MNAADEALGAYLKKEYPVILTAIEHNTVSANETWLVAIATKAFYAGFAAGNMSGSSHKHLLSLLARVHRDGGHYVAEHGVDQAVFDADIIVADLHAAKEHADGSRDAGL